METVKLGIVFDDVVVSDEGDWSQVCPGCVERLNFPKTLLDNTGSGICGVKGCWNESDYYIDFPKEQTEVVCPGCLKEVNETNFNTDSSLCNPCIDERKKEIERNLKSFEMLSLHFSQAKR